MSNVSFCLPSHKSNLPVTFIYFKGPIGFPGDPGPPGEPGPAVRMQLAKL